MQVALVSGFASGGSRVGPREEATEKVEPEQPKPERETVEPAGAGETAPEAPQSEPQDRIQSAPSLRLAMARAELGDAAGTFEGQAGATAAQGGDPTATSDMLAQIARCLPPGFRPKLSLSTLSLAIGPDGRLALAPAVASALPQLAAEDREAADRVVQAALLCGPYLHPDTLNHVVSLPVDFTDPSLKQGEARVDAVTGVR